MNVSPGHLVPHLQDLRFQLSHPSGLGSITPEQLQRIPRADAQLEILPYSLSAAAAAVRDLVQAGSALEPLHRPRLERDHAIQMLSEDERNTLSFHIDHFLDAGRRTQNAVIPYLRHAFATSLPGSFHDLVKRLESQKVVLPTDLVTFLVGYWQNAGLQLKNYRDLAQHHVVVSSEGSVFLSDETSVFSIFLVLPNNPEVRSPSGLRYRDPLVHAYPWVLTQFEHLLRFVYILTHALLDHDRPSMRMLVMAPKAGFSSPTPGIAVSSPAVIAQTLEQCLDLLRQEFPRRPPTPPLRDAYPSLQRTPHGR